MPTKMNIIKKISQKFVVDKLVEINWKNGSSSNPLVVELDTTEVCDLACPGCISEDLVSNGNSFSDERLLSLGKEFYEIGVKAVILIGGGEPLAHPQVGKFIEYLGKHDISIGITTNGSFINKHLDVIAKYSSWTRISMDAATDETFLKLRPSKSNKSKFNSIVRNMRDLAKIKKGKLGFSFLIRTEADGFGIKSNIHEIYDAAKLAKDIGCDYFEIKPSYNYSEGIDHSLVVHSKDEMEDAKKEIKRLEELVSDNFKVIKAINLNFSLNGVVHNQVKNYKKCPMTELRTLVCPSGVYVCPYWRAKNQFKIGDVNKTSFKDLWNGDRRKEVMKYLDASKHCYFHCLRHESNEEVFKMIDDLNRGNNVKIINEYDRFI